MYDMMLIKFLQERLDDSLCCITLVGTQLCSQVQGGQVSDYEEPPQEPGLNGCLFQWSCSQRIVDGCKQ